MNAPPHSRLQRIASAYRACALIVLNVLALLVALNAVLWLFFLVKDRVRPPPLVVSESAITAQYGIEKLRTIYPAMNDADIETLLNETWRRGQVYAPFVEFREKPFAGKFVNVDQTGFRRGAGQGIWPPTRDVMNVFIFGGSTTFGYGLADAETIPSRLQEALGGKVQVYNFGAAYYYSSQERLLFEELLAAGHVPALAVFIDGLNDFAQPVSGTAHSTRIDALFRGEPSNVPLPWWHSTPMGRLANSLKKRALPAAGVVPVEKAGDYTDTRVLDSVLDRYLANQRLIRAVADAEGVKPLFIWQPVPAFAHTPITAPFPIRDGWHRYAGHGYPRFATRLAKQPPGADFVWLAEMQSSLAEPLYVDQVHYNAVFARKIAERIAAEIGQRGLLK